MAVQGEGLPRDARFDSEPALPQPLTQDHHPTCVGRVFLGQESSSKLWLDAEKANEVSGDAAAVDPFGLADARQVKARVVYYCHAFEDLVLVAPVWEVAGRDRIDREHVCGSLLPDHDKPLGVLIGQGVQQDRINHAEDGAVRAYP